MRRKEPATSAGSASGEWTPIFRAHRLCALDFSRPTQRTTPPPDRASTWVCPRHIAGDTAPSLARPGVPIQYHPRRGVNPSRDFPRHQKRPFLWPCRTAPGGLHRADKGLVGGDPWRAT